MLPLLSLIPAVARIAGGMASGRADGRIKEAELGQNADRIALDRARLGQDQYNSSIGLDIDQRQYADGANDRSARNAMFASLLGGLQDYDMGTPPGLEGYMVQSSGGLRPSAITGREDISRLVRERAMSELENPLEAGGIQREAVPQADTGATMATARRGRGAGDYWNPQPEQGPGGDVGASAVIQEALAGGGRRMPGITLANLPQASQMPEPGLLDKILNGVAGVGSLVGAVQGTRAGRGASGQSRASSPGGQHYG